MRLYIIFLINIVVNSFCLAQTADTVKIMTYNVLHYGDRCQGSNTFLHSNLKTIVQYENPDILGLVKAQTIKLSTDDFVGISPVGFADSILVYALNAAHPGQYGHGPVVNFSNDVDGDMSLLFYNKSKFGFVSIANLCGIQEDFNLYKLFYKDPNLLMTRDTTFLYVILNHTVSGTTSASRDLQDSTIVKNLKKRFSHLPNLISMGDFNTHSSNEPGYQLLTASPDTSFVFRDPPYFPDRKLVYPSNWQSDPGSFSSYLNTSTRELTIPNACGTTGGAKGWYLHIIISPWLEKNTDYIQYVPNSYSTIGNDRRRVGISVNDSIYTTKNTSLPKEVINAIFNLSDKYPISVKLAITQNKTGISPPDPVIETITGIQKSKETIITTNNPIDHNLILHFPDEMTGKRTIMRWYDLSGRLLSSEGYIITTSDMLKYVDLPSGVYVLSLQIGQQKYDSRIVVK